MPVVFRSRLNRALSVVICAVATVTVIAVCIDAGSVVPRLVLFWIAVAGATWAVLWQPHVRVDDDGVRIVNVLHSVSVPWNALIHVDTKYALTLHVPGRAFTATSAPAPGRLGASLARRELRRSGGADGLGTRPGDLPTTDSGRAAAIVRDRWDGLRDAGRIEAGIADDVAVAPHWNVPAISALAVAVAATAFAWTL